MNKILAIKFVLIVAVVLLGASGITPAYADTSHCGTISSDETWSSSGNVHRITCDVIVASGVTLTIEEGAIVKFDSSRSLIVDGALNVTGTAGNPVYFTSYRDDTVGGDTNGDGSSTGSRSDWDRIEFTEFSDDASQINHAVIRYAGTGYSSYYGAITLVKASPSIRYSVIVENEFAGIRAYESTPTLICNNLYDNNGYGLHNGTTAIVVSAKNQWWGSPNGPYHEVTNPYGSGNEVTDGVDFVPWLTAPCGLVPPDQYMTYLPVVTR